MTPTPPQPIENNSASDLYLELDKELSREMHESANFLPLSSEDDAKSMLQSDSYSKLSTSSPAPDLVSLSQIPPRGPGANGLIDPALKSSEWPQFSGAPRPNHAVAQPRIQNATHSRPIGGLRPSSGMGRNSSSPIGIQEGGAILNTSAKSVPATPTSSRQSVGSLGGKAVGSGDIAPAYDTPICFISIQGGKENFVGNMNGEMATSPGLGSYDYKGMLATAPKAARRRSSSTTALVMDSHWPTAGSHPWKTTRRAGYTVPSTNAAILTEINRFAGTRLEDLIGEIPALCKDQHGCRCFRNKLEEGVPEHRDIIFRETFSLFAELMADPFGNYLCQELLKYSTDERNMVCESVAHDLVGVSLDMHGTRAVQKMIEFLSTQRQFIYKAVAALCVEVATQRHGCRVLQRCIDHVSDSQRIQSVTEITFNALTLVQDPYGNYVVQYILNLNDNHFSDAVIRQFVGIVCALSVQKFSSNVIEKCIRVAEHNTRKMLIEELLHPNRLEKLPRDSFGNSCVQTALDYAEPTQRMLLVKGIRPILPLIRNTPYGKRIQSKLQREQIENHHQQYGGHNFNQSHNALVGLAAMNGNGMNMGNRHVSQPSIHHSPLGDAYNRPNMYNMPPQRMYPGLQRQSMDHYGTLT
ncbi:Pumilio-family RNA binding repeat [Ceratobasidium sp. AG-Ba]|nr:Pumilio-family RNA binding repeat [Ceratobasidium sp. AG-Ba]QRV90361.1 Pumilio-family RNA binding repeat [Ceratobasidium sp. AG-Ba]